MKGTRIKMNQSQMQWKVCILDYGKDDHAWHKGKMIYEHMRKIEKKNPQMFRNMIRGPSDYEWLEIAKKTKGNWPHPYDHISKLASTIYFENSQDFQWLPYLNLFIFTVKDEREEMMVKEILPQVEIYDISDEG